MSETLHPERTPDGDPLTEQELKAISQRLHTTVQGSRGLKEGRALATAQKSADSLDYADTLAALSGYSQLYGVDHSPLLKEAKETLDSIPASRKGFTTSNNQTIFPADKAKSLLKYALGQRQAGIAPFDTLLEVERVVQGDFDSSNSRMFYYRMAQEMANAGNPSEAVRKINRGPDAPEVICYVARDDAILAVMRQHLTTDGPSATIFLNGITDPAKYAEGLSLLGEYFLTQQDPHNVRVIIERIKQQVPSIFYQHQQAKVLANAVDFACAIGEVQVGRKIFADIPTDFSAADQVRAFGTITRTLHQEGRDVEVYLSAMRKLVRENAQSIARRTDVLGNRDIIRQSYEVAKTQKACGVKEYDDIITEVETILAFPANIKNDNNFTQSEFAADLGKAYSSLGSFQRAWEFVPLIKVPRYRLSLYEGFFAQQKADIFTADDIADLPLATTTSLLQKNTQAAYAIGRFGLPLTEPTITGLSFPSQIAVRLGHAERLDATAFWEERSLSQEEAQQHRRDIREARSLQRSEPQNIELATQVIDGLVGGQPSSVASNHLVDMVKSFATLPPDIAMQVFSGLLRINNRKALAVGNDLYLRPDMPEEDKTRIAQRLMQHGYWDTQLLRHNTDGDVIHTLLKDLQLTPDVQSYTALASPGLLQGATVKERKEELVATRDSLTQLSGPELIRTCSDNERLAQIYFMIADKKKYATPSGYTLDHFNRMIHAIEGVTVHQPTLNLYKDVLKGVTKRGGIFPSLWPARSSIPGLSEQDASAVIADLVAGNPLVRGTKNEFVFPITLDSEEQFRQARDRFTQVWTQELPNLMLSAKLQHQPATVEEAMMSAQDPQADTARKEIKDILYKFNMQRDLVDMQTFSAIQRQVAQELSLSSEQTPTVTDIVRYLQRYLPHTPATSEWSTHFIESVTQLAQATEGRKGPSKKTSIRMSFLDKNDLARVTRFADGFISCIHSSSQDNFNRSLSVVSRVIKDPLSLPVEFSVDDTVTGYTFLLSAIDPRTGYPGWLINGIYDGNKNAAMVQKVLELIEEHPAARINAGFVGIASKYGGVIEQPEGYSPVPAVGVGLEAIRATGSWGPEKKKYDDTGTTANGNFRFGNYTWPVEKGPNAYIKYLR